MVFFCALSVLSFGLNAAIQVDSQTIKAKHLHAIGIITISRTNSNPLDMYKALSDKADSQGAIAYQIIEMREGGSWHATAKIYK